MAGTIAHCQSVTIYQLTGGKRRVRIAPQFYHRESHLRIPKPRISMWRIDSVGQSLGLAGTQTKPANRNPIQRGGENCDQPTLLQEQK